MKIVAIAALFATSSAVTLRSRMPTGSESLCAMRRAGKLNLEDTYFAAGKTFNEHRDGGFNTEAVQLRDDGDEPAPKKGAKKERVLNQTDFERHLQQNMGNNAGLVYNANF